MLWRFFRKNGSPKSRRKWQRNSARHQSRIAITSRHTRNRNKSFGARSSRRPEQSTRRRLRNITRKLRKGRQTKNSMSALVFCILNFVVPKLLLIRNQKQIIPNTISALRPLIGFDWKGHSDVVFFVQGAYCDSAANVRTFKWVQNCFSTAVHLIMYQCFSRTQS